MTAPDDPTQQAAEDTLVALGNTHLLARSWQPDGQGVVADGIVGGDGAGEAVSVRYLNRHVPNARITAYFHVVDQRDRHSTLMQEPDPFFVEEMVEYFVAAGPVTEEDPHEVWSDYTYDDHAQSFATEAEAEAFRDRVVAADKAEDYIWDGTMTFRPR